IGSWLDAVEHTAGEICPSTPSYVITSFESNPEGTMVRNLSVSTGVSMKTGATLRPEISDSSMKVRLGWRNFITANSTPDPEMEHFREMWKSHEVSPPSSESANEWEDYKFDIDREISSQDDTNEAWLQRTVLPAMVNHYLLDSRLTVIFKGQWEAGLGNALPSTDSSDKELPVPKPEVVTGFRLD
ncbi:hypothetical protein MMC14_010213, partial [Varicellaria rhodocarpa]|nr:hypothetical protein [Varicellaria rhodocarpa]